MTPRSARDDTFVEFVCDQLDSIDGIVHKSMFGGYGLYWGSTFFGMAYKGELFFKTSDVTRPKYEAWGMEPFKPRGKKTIRAYYQVPADCLDNPAELVELAEEAIAVATEG